MKHSKHQRLLAGLLSIVMMFSLFAPAVSAASVQTAEGADPQRTFTKLPQTVVTSSNATSAHTPASGGDGPASLAFDNNLNTGWHSDYNVSAHTLPQDIEWTLDRPYMVGQIEYQKKTGGSNGLWIDVKVEGKLNDGNWFPMGGATGMPTDQASVMIDLEPHEVTALKVTVTDSQNANGPDQKFASAGEINTYADLTELAPGTVIYNLLKQNVISNVSASSQETQGEQGQATKAFDGNESTFWHTKYTGGQDPLPHTIQWNVGEAKMIGQIEYVKRPGNTATSNGNWKKINIEGKNGDGKWVTLVTDKEIPTSAARIKISFTPTMVTDLKVTVQESVGSYGSAAEIYTYEVFYSVPEPEPEPEVKPLPEDKVYSEIYTYTDISATSEHQTNASTGDGPARWAFDGMTNTAWHIEYSDRLPQSIQWAFGGAVKTVGQIGYIRNDNHGNNTGNGRWKTIEIYGQLENQTGDQWTLLRTYTIPEDAMANDGQEVKIPFNPTPVKAMKVNVTDSYNSGSDKFAQAGEIKAYEVLDRTFTISTSPDPVKATLNQTVTVTPRVRDNTWTTLEGCTFRWTAPENSGVEIVSQENGVAVLKGTRAGQTILTLDVTLASGKALPAKEVSVIVNPAAADVVAEAEVSYGKQGYTTLHDAWANVKDGGKIELKKDVTFGQNGEPAEALVLEGKTVQLNGNKNIIGNPVGTTAEENTVIWVKPGAELKLYANVLGQSMTEGTENKAVRAIYNQGTATISGTVVGVSATGNLTMANKAVALVNEGTMTLNFTQTRAVAGVKTNGIVTNANAVAIENTGTLNLDKAMNLFGAVVGGLDFTAAEGTDVIGIAANGTGTVNLTCEPGERGSTQFSNGLIGGVNSTGPVKHSGRIVGVLDGEGAGTTNLKANTYLYGIYRNDASAAQATTDSSLTAEAYNQLDNTFVMDKGEVRNQVSGYATPNVYTVFGMELGANVDGTALHLTNGSAAIYRGLIENASTKGAVYVDGSCALTVQNDQSGTGDEGFARPKIWSRKGPALQLASTATVAPVINGGEFTAIDLVDQNNNPAVDVVVDEGCAVTGFIRGGLFHHNFANAEDCNDPALLAPARGTEGPVTVIGGSGLDFYRVVEKNVVNVTATFKNGNDVVSTVELEQGSALGTLPAGPSAPANKVFKGWKNETTNEMVTAATIIDQDTTYVAVFGLVEKENRSVRFFAYVDGKLTLLDTRTLTTYWIDNKHRIPASVLAEVYADFGFQATDLKAGEKKFLHANKDEVTIWAESAIEFEGTVYASTLNQPDKTEIDVVYLPKQTVSGSVGRGDTNMIAKETFYTVTNGENVRYFLTGTKAVITLDNVDGKNWTMTGKDNAVVNGVVADGKTTFTVDAIAQPYTVAQVDAPAALFDLYGASVVLENSLEMRFFVEKSKLPAGPLTAEITKTYADSRPAKTETVSSDNWTASGDLMYFSFNGIAAKEMMDTVTVVIKDASGKVLNNTYTDSIHSYALRQLEKAETPAGLKTVLVDMLNYGAACQTEFKYNEAKLANADIDAYQEFATKEVQMNNELKSSENYYGSALDTSSQILFNLYFTDLTAEMRAEVTFTDHYGHEHTKNITGDQFVQSGDLYAIVVDELVMADVNRMVTCKVFDADNQLVASVEDSIESYAARMAGTAENKAVYESIVKFGTSSETYFKTPTI